MKVTNGRATLEIKARAGNGFGSPARSSFSDKAFGKTLTITVGRRAALRAAWRILLEVGLAGSGRDRTITWTVGTDE